jgi:hypothetical protein
MHCDKLTTAEQCSDWPTLTAFGALEHLVNSLGCVSRRSELPVQELDPDTDNARRVPTSSRS